MQGATSKGYLSIAAASALVLGVTSAPGQAPAGTLKRFALEQEQVMLTYQAQVGRQQISGVSRAVQGGVEELPGRGLRVKVSVPVRSFETGSAAVDAILAHAVDTDRFPDVEFEGEAPLGKRAGQFTVKLAGTLTVHGVSQPVSVPVKVVRDGQLFFVQASFAVDLAAFGLQAPSLGSLEVSPRLQIDFASLLRSAPAQTASAL
jgi:polyisoprenoid-binding protein YceI